MGINDYIQVGSRMKEYRINSGLTQREMAKKLELSFSTYSNYENNYREPPIEIIKKFCEVLSISVADLLDGIVKVGTSSQEHAENFKKHGYSLINLPMPDKKFYRKPLYAQRLYVCILIELFGPDVVFKYYKVSFSERSIKSLQRLMPPEVIAEIKKHIKDSEHC